MPTAPGGAGAVLATAGLAAGGTLLPFTLFAYAQSRVSAEMAGAFLNLEPLVGAAAGVAVFGDPAGPRQLTGGAAILAGIALSSLPLLRTGPRRPVTGPEPAPQLRAHDGPGIRASAGRRARAALPTGSTHPCGTAGRDAGRPGRPPGRRRSGGPPGPRHCRLSGGGRIGRARWLVRRCRMGPGPAARWWHPAPRRRVRSSHPPPRASGAAA
jgi:EamA-like transporter family